MLLSEIQSTIPTPNSDPLLPTTPHISLHVMLSHSFPETLCLQATIFNNEITVLVDGAAPTILFRIELQKF